MRMMKQSVAMWSVAILLLPGLAVGRSPLSDSTDVKIPTVRSESENSIAVSPLNSKVLLVSNIAAAGGDHGGVTSWISLDAGKTWLTSDSLVLDPSRSDPAVVIGRSGGTNGRYFVNHLDSSNYELGVHYKNTTGGTSWTHVQITTGDDGTDKPHLAINNNTSGTHTNWLISAYSAALAISGIDLFYSSDNGASWNGPHNIAQRYDSRDYRGVNVQWGPASSGKVYACWAIRSGAGLNAFVPENIGFRYSTDVETWSEPSGGQAIQGTNGFISLPGKSMPLNLQAPAMAVNMNDGHLYIVYTTKPANGDADVYVIKSTNEGETWGSPVRVHAATTGKDQWQPWISWDDCSGAVVVTFLDSRDFTNNDGANTYMSVSYDDAASWTDFKVSDAGWDGDGFSGHYMGLAAKDGMAFPVWSDDRETSGIFKPYISPVYLFGVAQSSVQHSLLNDEGLQLTVTAQWSTNLSSTGSDYLVITSPTNVTYTASGTGSGTSHSLSKTCGCEAGDWTYQVKSARPGFTARGSNPKVFRITACVD